MSVDRARGVVVVSHGAIAGVMQAMTMTYAVRERPVLLSLSPGDEITADVVVDDSGAWLEKIVVVKKADASPGQR